MSDALRITAPHFVAGVVLNAAGYVARAAPIVAYMLGWEAQQVRDYAARKGWDVLAGPAQRQAG